MSGITARTINSLLFKFDMTRKSNDRFAETLTNPVAKMFVLKLFISFMRYLFHVIHALPCDKAIKKSVAGNGTGKKFFSVLLNTVLAVYSNNAFSEWSGNVAVESRYFIHDAQFPGQEDDLTGSISLQPEFRQQWKNGDAGFTFIPFVRVDSSDDERSHADIRELYFLQVKDELEFRLGINKVFWGVLEFQHIVDIINQTDAVENIDGEDKLGQPMLHLSVNKDLGLFEVFLLPYFRERTFAGKDGRLRPALAVDTDNPRYQSSDEENHFDYALRWSHYFGNYDVGISWFDGTARQPAFQISEDRMSLVPFYYQIEQTGLDLQYTGEQWLWKLESIYRQSINDSIWAAGAGFEYTFIGINDSDADLGILMEYHYDERNESQAAFQNDLFTGARLVMNDVQSTEFLAGLGFDLDDQSRSFRLEASSRIGDSIKLNLEAQYFSQIDDENLLSDFSNDSHLQLELVWYF